MTETISPSTAYLNDLRKNSSLESITLNELLRRLSLFHVVAIKSDLGDKNEVSCPIKTPKERQPLGKGSMPIQIVMMTGRMVTIKTACHETIEDVKERLQEVEGIPIDQQRLVYMGKQLDDERTLSDYNIGRNAELHLVLRLRGGMYHSTSGHSGLHKSFFLDVSLPFKRGSFQLYVHGGNTIKELTDIIVKASNDLGRINQVKGCALFIDNIPLASEDPNTDTLEKIGFGPNLNKIQLVSTC